MSDLRKAGELESLRYADLAEKANLRERQKVEEFRRSQASRGTLQSGATFMGIARIRAEKTEELILGRIAIRKDLALEFPELGAEHALDALLADLEGLTSLAFKGLYQTPGLQIEGAVGQALRRRDEQEVSRLNAFAHRQIEMLKREIALKLHKKVPSDAVSVVTGGGPAIVNLGTIYGNVQQVIGNVSEGGYQELAELLQQLAKAINDSEALGQERAAYLEQVQFIASQAAQPVETRQPGVVKGLLAGLRAGLADAAHISHILVLVGPALAQHFGFAWPF